MVTLLTVVMQIFFIGTLLALWIIDRALTRYEKDLRRSRSGSGSLDGPHCGPGPHCGSGSGSARSTASSTASS